jgi:hypothetical protein
MSDTLNVRDDERQSDQSSTVSLSGQPGARETFAQVAKIRFGNLDAKRRHLVGDRDPSF